MTPGAAGAFGSDPPALRTRRALKPVMPLMALTTAAA